MPRLALLLSGCSAFLVATWLVAGNHEASLRATPVQQASLHSLHAGHNVANEEGANRDLNEPMRAFQADKGAPKKKGPMKGVGVDRANIREDVTLDELQAPEGRMWIPAAIAGPIEHDAPKPLFNVLVAYCQLDMASYHDTPWLFAMGTFHQRHSGCLDDKSLVRTYRLSDLMVSQCYCCASAHAPISRTIQQY